MTSQPSYNIPDSFLALLKEKMELKGFSLRQVARMVNISPAYLSRIFSKERGLPPDPTILRIAEALDIQPREALLIEAGRTPESIQGQLRNPQVPMLLHAIAPLSKEDLRKVMRTAQALRLKHNNRKSAA